LKKQVAFHPTYQLLTPHKKKVTEDENKN